MGDAAGDVGAVPALGMPHIGNRNVVMLAPEEGDDLARDLLAEHVLGGDLAETLGDHPVFDADLLARVSIGPARDVSREDPGELVCKSSRR